MSSLAGFVPEPYWLIHHGVLLEWTTEHIEERLDYIHEHKPSHEVPIRLQWLRRVKQPQKLPPEVLTLGDLGLRLLEADVGQSINSRRLIVEAVDAEKRRQEQARQFQYQWGGYSGRNFEPGSVIQARLGLPQADAEIDRRRQLLRSARARIEEVMLRHQGAIDALHKEECPGCPFDYVRRELMFHQTVRPHYA